MQDLRATDKQRQDADLARRIERLGQLVPEKGAGDGVRSGCDLDFGLGVFTARAFLGQHHRRLTIDAHILRPVLATAGQRHRHPLKRSHHRHKAAAFGAQLQPQPSRPRADLFVAVFFTKRPGTQRFLLLMQDPGNPGPQRIGNGGRLATGPQRPE